MKKNSGSKPKRIEYGKTDNGSLQMSFVYGSESEAAEAIFKNSINFTFSEKDFLLFRLFQVHAGLKLDKPEELTAIQQIEAALHFFNNYVLKVEFTPLKGNTKNFKYAIELHETETEEIKAFIEKSIKEIIETPVIKQTIEVAIVLPKKQGLLNFDQLQTKTHKQPRSMLRTIAKNVGRDTNIQAPSLFTLPLNELQSAIENSPTKNGLPFKEKLSKSVGLTSLQLLKLSQKVEQDKEGYYIINDLGSLANELKIDTKELKYCLLYLGGYQYPSAQYYEDEEEISFQFAKLFDIKFYYNSKHAAKGQDEKAIIKGDTFKLFIDTPIKRLTYKPNEVFLRDLQKKDRSTKALGYINVSDNFTAFVAGLSVYAFKLLSYMAANRPSYKISEEKLFINLGLEKQVKTQKPARLRNMLTSAFKELKDAGHLEDYEIKEEATGILYSWQYTDKYIKHQDSERKAAESGAKKKAGVAEYIDFNDTSIDIEIRKKAFTEWLVKEKNKTPEAAKKQASRLK